MFNSWFWVANKRKQNSKGLLCPIQGNQDSEVNTDGQQDNFFCHEEKQSWKEVKLGILWGLCGFIIYKIEIPTNTGFSE